MTAFSRFAGLAPFVERTMRDCAAYRIAPDDSNHFALVFDDRDDHCGLVAAVEIFDIGGRTPPNCHLTAIEFFFVLAGQGRACMDGQWQDIATGDALMVRPGTRHVLQNTGSSRLYCLTLMVPDENFAALIRSGQRVELDAEDRRVLGG